MSANNRTIVLKGDLSPNRIKSYQAAAAFKPGHLVKLNSSTKALKHATVGGIARKMFATENGKVGDLITTAYAADDWVECFDALPGDMINCRLPAAAVSIAVGDFGTSNGDGCLVKMLSPGTNVLYSQVAASSTVTNTATITAFDISYTIPANLLRAGDTIHVWGYVHYTSTNSTDTAIITLKLGSTSILVSATVDPADNDLAYFDTYIKIRTIGTSGTYVNSGFIFNGTPSVVAAATDAPSADFTASTAINTTTTNAITVSVTWSVASTSNIARLDDFNVELIRGSTGAQGDYPIGICEEAVDNSAGSDEAFCAFTII